jgi:hypothetical protein
MDENEQQEISNAVRNDTARQMRYTGEPTMTRGDLGENVEIGYAFNGCVYVWDSSFGWFNWGSVESAPFVNY